MQKKTASATPRSDRRSTTKGATPMSLHDIQSAQGAKWMKRQGFAVVATEVVALGCQEIADVVGFRSTCSMILESKVSREDFLRDLKKPHRHEGGLGLYRFFICPPGVILESDLPPRWGLLYYRGKMIEEVVRPAGNFWPGPDTKLPQWRAFQNQPDLHAERKVLFSLCRRLTSGETIN